MIAILMGGWSAEREISLKGGEAILKALTTLKIPCFTFDVKQETIDELWTKKFTKAFIILHGRGGEDGFIQKELEKRNIPYTGSGVEVSKLAMDKIKTKQQWLKDNIPSPKSIIAGTKKPDFPLPWAVKPVLEGSSIGISKVTDIHQLDDAVSKAKKFDSTVMIEQWIEGDEYTIGVLNSEALPVIKLEINSIFYDYYAKYQSSNTKHLCPCGLDKDKEQQLQELALKAYKSIGATTWARVDMMIDKNSKPFLLEINTIPGMTSHSLVPTAAKAQGISFEELVKKILN